MIPPPPSSTLFPYTTLFRSYDYREDPSRAIARLEAVLEREPAHAEALRLLEKIARENGDRKSTRLNSSHITISYAVFCLKKKKQPATNEIHNQHTARDLDEI